jgi:hypothetical protein
LAYRYAMKRAFSVGIPALILPALLLAYAACASDPAVPVEPDVGPSPTSTQTQTPRPGEPPTGDSAVPDSAANDAQPDEAGRIDAGCIAVPVRIDGGGLCGTLGFGSPEALLRDASADFVLDGSADIPPGVYEVTYGERTTSLPYSWRETLVLDGSRYTQIRRFDIRQGTAGPTNSRGGTYTTANGKIRFTTDCAKAEDAGNLDPSSSEFSYEVGRGACGVNLKLIVAGTLLTFDRR